MIRLHAIGTRCARSRDFLVENLAEMLDVAVWIGLSSAGTLHLSTEPGGALDLVAHRGCGAGLLDCIAHVAPGDGSVCGAALSTGARVIVDDLDDASSRAEPARRALFEAGVRAVQATPLVSSAGTIVGLLATYFAEPHRPTDREHRLLDLLARQAADYVERTRGEEQREALLRIASRALAEAEAANRAKDQFLAMLGHELRNPLSAVRNAVAVAMLDDACRPQALAIARRQAEQLDRIVDDLLDVARITSGRVPLRKTRVRLADVVDRAVESARALMTERGQTLRTEAAPESLVLDADPARLEQALTNLLGNAAKYSAPGGTVTVIVEAGDGDAVVRVRDTGIGIAPETLPTIFDLFAQGDRSLDRGHGGLGIGLTVVRRIVELHGGTVIATSEGLGRGAEFVVRLPALVAAMPAAEAPAATPIPPDLRPARVLLVEDNPDAAESLMMLLELLGHSVRVVHDGLAALDAARASAPDIMLIDIGLPGMDGYELAQAIRADPAIAHLVLAALTGYGRPEDKARGFAAGFDYHLVKPVDPDALGGLVARLGGRSGGGPGSRAADTRH